MNTDALGFPVIDVEPPTELVDEAHAAAERCQQHYARVLARRAVRIASQ